MLIARCYCDQITVERKSETVNFSTLTSYLTLSNQRIIVLFETWREKVIKSPHLLLLVTPQTRGSLELISGSQVPAGTQLLGPSLLLPRHALAGSWTQEQAQDLNSGTAMWEVGALGSILPTMPHPSLNQHLTADADPCCSVTITTIF